MMKCFLLVSIFSLKTPSCIYIYRYIKYKPIQISCISFLIYKNNIKEKQKSYRLNHIRVLKFIKYYINGICKIALQLIKNKVLFVECVEKKTKDKIMIS